MPVNYQIPMANDAVLSTGNDSGICMAIACFWIQRCNQLGARPGAMDQYFTNWREYETMAVAFETLLGDYNNLTGGDGNIVSQNTLFQQGLAWHDIFTVQLGLQSGEVNWGSDDTLGFLLSLMDNGGAGGYLLTGYEVDTTNGFSLDSGHTFAFWFDQAGMGANKTFLDPNEGTWTVLRTFNWIPDILQELAQEYGDFNQYVLINMF